MNELIRQRGFRIGAVAEAIGVNQNTMTRWTGNAPIEKLFLISDFTHIPIIEIIECFRPDRDDQTQSDRTGGETN